MRQWLRKHRPFVLLFFTYAYFFPGGDANQGSRFFMTSAIVERGAADITPDHAAIIDKGYDRGKYYSDKAPGIALLATLPYAVMRLAERAFFIDAQSRSTKLVRLHVLSILMSGLPGVLAAYFLRRAAVALGQPPSAASTVALAYGLGTLVFPFATMMLGHALAASLAIIAFTRIVENKSELCTPRLVQIGAILGGAIVVEYTSGLFVIPLGVLAAVSGASGLRAVALRVGAMALGAAGLLGAHAAYVTWAYGSPIRLPYHYLIEPVFTAHTAAGLFGIRAPSATAAFGILLSRSRGLFFMSPVLALSFAGFACWISRGGHRLERFVVAAIPVAYVLVASSYYDWQGGVSAGARHLVPAIAFLALSVGFFAAAGRWQHVLTIALTVPGICIMALAVGVLAHQQQVDPWRADPYYELLLPRLLAGEVHGDTWDIYGVLPARDVAYNLGTLFGVGPWLSLGLPLAVWAAAYGRDALRAARRVAVPT